MPLSTRPARPNDFVADSGSEIVADAAAWRHAAEHFGGLDIRINSAGIARVTRLEEFSQEDFERMLAVNVQGVVAATLL